MSRIPKIVAVLAGLAAAGCNDSFALPPPPLDSFFFPVGVAVRPLSPSQSALIVVSTNFDLRYDQDTGGTVLSVDPEASVPLGSDGKGGQLAVLGALNIASFGGEVAWTDAVDSGAAWRPPGSYCPQLEADPVIAAGGAKVLVASRAILQLYRIDMDARGALSHRDDWITQLNKTQVPITQLDPYGVTIVCSGQTDRPTAHAYFTLLRGLYNEGWMSRLDLNTGALLNLDLGPSTTYTSAYDPAAGWLFISSVFGISPLRWMNPLLPVPIIGGVGVPEYQRFGIASLVAGGLTRDLAVSNDRRFLFVSLQLVDPDLYGRTGQIYTQGGALAAFDLAPTALNQPRMTLLQLVPTCLGGGQLRVLPPRAGKGDLVAVTCDLEGSLAIYDDEIGKVVRYVALDPVTGQPALGRQPFGLAVETLDGARAAGPGSPCVPGRPCDRIYAASFELGIVNLLELDPDEPASAVLVKRIGRIQ